MKKKNIIRFLLNVALYTAIVLLLYFLYSPLNDDPGNKPGSSVQFVYQQF